MRNKKSTSNLFPVQMSLPHPNRDKTSNSNASPLIGKRWQWAHGDDGGQWGGIILACCNNDDGNWAEDFVCDNLFWLAKQNETVGTARFCCFGCEAQRDWLDLWLISGWYDA